jgi:hypothetical protein
LSLIDPIDKKEMKYAKNKWDVLRNFGIQDRTDRRAGLQKKSRGTIGGKGAKDK